MKQHYLGLAAVPALLLLSSCLDDKYDLANIDTTTEIKVTDLVVPVQLNAITLDDATDLDDNEFIEVYTDDDGQRAYAFRRTETFKSGTIRINSFSVAPSAIPAVDIALADLAGAPAKRAFALNPIRRIESTSFTATLPADITEIDRIGVAPTKIAMVLRGMSTSATIKAEKVLFRFPKGLNATRVLPEGAKYDKTSGVVTVNNLAVGNTTSTQVEVAVFFDGIDNSNEISISGRTLTYSTAIGVWETTGLMLDGTYTSSAKLRMSFDMPRIDATTLSASVAHHIDNVSFNPVYLDGIPDFLAGTETSLSPVNPQIYVGIDNTVGDFSGTTKLSFKSYFANGDTSFGTTPTAVEVSKDLRTNILLAAKAGTQAVNALTQYLSPKPTSYAFPALANALTLGSNPCGLPRQIQVTASDVNVTGTKVRNLPLSEYVPGFEGSYTVFVPLAFNPGTKIVYTSEETGWNTDMLKDINIYKLNLNATVSTTIPVGFGFKVTLLDENNRVLATSNDFEVNPDSNPQPVNLEILASKDNPIRNLDGIRYVATIEQNSSNQTPLGPDQHITLSDIRITVDGAYLYEDDKD